MVWTKRTKRTPNARKRTKTQYKRTSRYSSASRVNRQKDLHFFTRYSLATTVTGNAIFAPWSQGFTYALSQVPNVSEFANMFDRYKITYVKHYFTLMIDPSAQSASTASVPQIYYVRDYDDSTAITPTQMREHGKMRRLALSVGKTVGIGIRPAVLNEIYRSAISTTYEPKWNVWIDMATTDVPYYGLKVNVEDLTNTNYVLKHEVKFWFACKDIR